MITETSKMMKLIILCILHRVDMPISNSQISNYMLENDYTDYFKIQVIMGELIDDGFVFSRKTRNRTFYGLTPAGKESYEVLTGELSQKIRDDVDEYIKTHQMQISEENNVRSSYVETGLGAWDVNLSIDESGERIFEINVKVYSEEEASRICSAWQHKSEELYPMFFEKLLSRNA